MERRLGEKGEKKMDGKACSVSGLPPAGDEEDGGKREGKKSSVATFLGVCVCECERERKEKKEKGISVPILL